MTKSDNQRPSRESDAIAIQIDPPLQMTKEWVEPQGENSFADIFRAQTEVYILSGGPHLTLGANLTSSSLADAGLAEVDLLRSYGLTATSVCVDYGCGTLRVGKHLIRQLPAGAYWGLDISACLIDEGVRLMGRELADAKRPNLRVISDETVAEAAAGAPDLVFSIAVLMHVHPRELPRFAEHLSMLMGRRGRLLFNGRCSERTTRHGPRSWSHGREQLDAVFADHGVRLLELASEPSPKPGVPDGRKIWFRGECASRCVLDRHSPLKP
jgi:SAM-dependent methyltransferase